MVWRAQGRLQRKPGRVEMITCRGRKRGGESSLCVTVSGEIYLLLQSDFILNHFVWYSKVQHSLALSVGGLPSKLSTTTAMIGVSIKPSANTTYLFFLLLSRYEKRFMKLKPFRRCPLVRLEYGHKIWCLKYSNSELCIQ